MLPYFELYDSFSVASLIPMFILLATATEFLFSAIKSVKNHDETALAKHAGGTMIVFLVEFLLFMLTSILGRAAMIVSTAQIHVGVRPHWLDSFRIAIKNFCAILLACLAFGVALIMAWMVLFLSLGILRLVFGKGNSILLLFDALIFMAFFAFAIYLYVVAVIVFPTIVIERRPIKESIRRAFDLASGKWCELFCVLMICLFFQAMVNGFVRRVLFNPHNMDPTGVLMGAIASHLPQLVFMPLDTM